MNIRTVIFGEQDEFLRKREADETSVDKGITLTHIVPEKFREDVRALAGYIGESDFKSGLSIEVSLNELLGVVPRKRRRTDAYDALVKYLKDEQNISLIIKTSRS